MKSYDQPRQNIKKQTHYFTSKSPSSQGYGFSSSRVWMWEMDPKESWVLKNWCFLIVALEKTLESSSDCKKIKPVNPKGSQSWIFIGRTDVEAEDPILWPPDAKNWLIWKDPDAGKDWRQEKGTIEDKVVWWHHQLDQYEFEQVPVVGEGQRRLACCNPYGHRESDMTEWLSWIECKVCPREFFMLAEWLLWRIHILMLEGVFYKYFSIKKAEHWRIDAIELWCWKRLSKVSWTARSNQTVLKEINTEEKDQC